MRAHIQLTGSTVSVGSVGVAIAGELRILGTTRISARWFNPTALASFSIDDGPGESNVSPRMWEIGVHQVLGAAEMIAPFVGMGVGAYRRDWGNGRRTYAALCGLIGFDIRPEARLSPRIAVGHHEVFSDDLEGIYGGRFRITSLVLGLSYAVQ